MKPRSWDLRRHCPPLALRRRWAAQHSQRLSLIWSLRLQQEINSCRVLQRSLECPQNSFLRLGSVSLQKHSRRLSTALLGTAKTRATPRLLFCRRWVSRKSGCAIQPCVWPQVRICSTVHRILQIKPGVVRICQDKTHWSMKQINAIRRWRQSSRSLRINPSCLPGPSVTT